MLISDQVDQLVYPKACHPCALKCNKGCDGFRARVTGTTDRYDKEEDDRASHCDEGQDKFTGSIAGLVFVNLVAVWALFHALVLVEVEASDTR